jgi:hypothetical protein
MKKQENRQKRHRVHASYYEYVSNVVDKCGHKYLILDNKGFRSYRFETQSNPNAKMPSGKLMKITPAKCKSYSCPICGQKKVMDLVEKLKNVDLKKYRFFTLTLKNKKTLADTEKNLLEISKHFNKLNVNLRKRPEFKGLEYFRVTEIGKDGMVHIHGIWNKYIPSVLLSEMWLKITKTSYIVKVERIKNKKDAVKYLYKYLTKDACGKNKNLDPAFWNSDIKNAAAMFYESGKRRYCSSRGFFTGIKVKKSDWLPYYYESQDVRTVENVISSVARLYKLKPEQFDFTYYFASDQFIENLFFSDYKPPG